MVASHGRESQTVKYRNGAGEEVTMEVEATSDDLLVKSAADQAIENEGKLPDLEFTDEGANALFKSMYRGE